MSASVRCVACTAVVRRPEHAVIGRSSSVGRAAVEPLCGGVLGRLLAEVDVQRTGRRGSATAARSRGRHRADGVDRRPDPAPFGRWARSAPTSGRPRRSTRAVAEPLLHLVQRLVALRGQTAGQVADVEQGEPDAGLGRRPRSARAPIALGSAYGRPSLIMVQVVELADGGVPGQHHLGVDGRGQVQVAVRVEPAGEARTSAAARSRTCRRLRGCDRAGRGGRRGCGRWPTRAQRPRRAARRPDSGGVSVVTARDHAVGDGDPHPVGDAGRAARPAGAQ